MRLVAFVLVLLLLFTGCVPHYEPAYRVVTAVSVTVSHQAQLRHYRYTDHPRIQAVLNYLRRLKPYAPQDIAPETFRSDAFRIILHRSDGTETVYHQIADGFLQKNGGPWHRVDPAHASSLSRLLGQLEQSG